MKNKRMKMITILAGCLFAVTLLAGCASNAPSKPAAQQSQTNENKSKGIAAGSFEQPILITCIGQSADGQMVKTLAERSGLKYSYDALAKPEDAAKNKTLLLVVGGSSKGLGAAGINAEQEEKRASDLIAKAKEAKSKIIVAHVGGESRRGEMTDRFIKLTAPQADYMIVVADGDKDKIFANAGSGNIPTDYPKSIADVAGFLKTAFNK